MNDDIPPQLEKVEQVPQGFEGDQVPIVGGSNCVLLVTPKLTNREIREAFLDLARAFTNQVNLSMETRVNVVESTMIYILRDFVRMNPPIFLVSKVGEDPQEIIDEGYIKVHAMGVTSREIKMLSSYQLRAVSQVWYTQWIYNRPKESCPIE